MPCSDAEVRTVETMGPAGLQQLIMTWKTGTTAQPLFRGKMIVFFRNAFQQTGFTPTDDFKPQLLENGGFDFGPLGTGAVGDDVFFKLVQNLQDSFAITAWQLIAEGTAVHRRAHHPAVHDDHRAQEPVRPDRDAQRPAVRVQRRGNTTTKLPWKVDYGNAIPLEQALDPTSPNYMVFDDSKPTSSARFALQPTCQGVGA